MAINFPDNPSLNDTFVANGVTYTWNGKSWSSTISSATVLNDLTDVDTTGAINGSVIKYDGANWVIGTDLDVANPFDQSLNTTDFVTFDGIESTSGGSFSGGTTTISISSTFSYPSYTSPFAITNTGGDTVAFGMNVVGNDVDFINDNGTLRIKSDTTEVFSVDGLGTVTATSFVGDGSGLTGLPPGYTDSDVDTHLNTGTATNGQILSWNGSDYAWVVDASGSTFDQNLNTTDDVTFNSVTTGALTVNGAGTSTIQSGNNIVLDATNRVLVSDTPFRLASLTTVERDAIVAPENGDMIYNLSDNKIQYYENGSWNNTTHYTDSDVDTHLNTGTATNGQILSWNGSDYAWVADQAGSGGISLTDLSVGPEDPASGDGGIAYDNTTGVFTYTPPNTYTEVQSWFESYNGVTTETIVSSPLLPTTGTRFGTKRQIRDGKIIVGAERAENGGFSQAGLAYIYDLDGSNLITLSPSDPDAFDNFGMSVAVDINRAVVGAPYNDDNGFNSGSAYIFNLDGTNEVKLTASDAAANDYFGAAVAVGDNKVVVGAQGNDDVPNTSGSIYIYDLDGTNEIKVTASDASSGANFGTAVAVGNNKIAVSAPGDNSSSGALYVYDLDGTNEVKIVPSNVVAGDFFGTASGLGGVNGVKIINNRVYAKADNGSVYGYNLDGTGEVIYTFSDAAKLLMDGPIPTTIYFDVSDSYVYLKNTNLVDGPYSFKYNIDGTNETLMIQNFDSIGEGIWLTLNDDETFSLKDENGIVIASNKNNIVSASVTEKFTIRSGRGITPSSGVNATVNEGLKYNTTTGLIDLAHLDIYYYSRHYHSSYEDLTNPWSVFINFASGWSDEKGNSTVNSVLVQIKKDFGVNPVVEGGINSGVDYQEGAFIESIIGKSEYELDQTKWYRTIRSFTVRLNTSGNGAANPSDTDYIYWYVTEGTWFNFTSDPTNGSIYNFKPGRQQDDGFALLYQYINNISTVADSYDGTVGYPLDTSDSTEYAIKVLPGKSNRNDYTQDKFDRSIKSWFHPATTVDLTTESKFTSSDNVSGDAFGRGIAVGPTKIIVGAPFDDGPIGGFTQSNVGAAYLYNLDGTGEIKIQPSAGIANDYFGTSVAIDDTRVAIGAYGHDTPNGSSSGAVYVYDLTGSNEIKIYASDGASGDDFGLSVALHDNKLVVGARDNLTDGSVYVYDLSSGVQATILASEVKIRQSAAALNSSSDFGSYVLAKDGKIAVAGEEVSSTYTGLPDVWTVYLYNMDGTGEQKFQPNPRDRLSSGAQSYDIYNGKLVVGVPYSYEYSGSESISEIYIYDIASGELEIDYTIETPYFEQYVGDWLKVRNGKIYVSAYKEDTYFDSSFQVIYVLDFYTGEILQIVESSDNASGDRFGDPFDVTDTLLAVSADGDDPGGSVYLYDIVSVNEKLTDPNFGFNSAIDTHLNTSTATSGQILSWNGSDYAWVADQAGSGGISLTDLSVGPEDPASGDGAIAYDNTTGVFTYTPPDLTSYTETDPVVGAVNGIVKADGAGNISAAIAGTDYTLANQSLDTTSNVTFNQLQVDSSITENNHTLVGTSVALNPANGTIQTHTLTGPTTYTDSLLDGQSVTLLIPATSETITWPTIKWQGGSVVQPDATDDTLILIFKIGTTLYGSSGGTFS